MTARVAALVLTAIAATAAWAWWRTNPDQPVCTSQPCECEGAR